MKVIIGRSTTIFTCEDHKHMADVYIANLDKSLESDKNHSIQYNRIDSAGATVFQIDFCELRK